MSVHASIRSPGQSEVHRFTCYWGEMVYVKELFWDDTELVVQFHPPKSVYVNANEHVLHLWKNTRVEIPLPPQKCV